MDSQLKQILSALEAGEEITPLDALDRFNCFRLAARIWDLRDLGHNIKSRTVKTNTGKRIVHYYIPQTAPLPVGQQKLGLGV